MSSTVRAMGRVAPSPWQTSDASAWDFLSPFARNNCVDMKKIREKIQPWKLPTGFDKPCSIFPPSIHIRLGDYHIVQMLKQELDCLEGNWITHNVILFGSFQMCYQLQWQSKWCWGIYCSWCCCYRRPFHPSKPSPERLRPEFHLTAISNRRRKFVTGKDKWPSNNETASHAHECHQVI